MIDRQAGVTVEFHDGTGKDESHTAAVAVAAVWGFIVEKFDVAVHFGGKIETENIVVDSGADKRQPFCGGQLVCQFDDLFAFFKLMFAAIWKGIVSSSAFSSFSIIFSGESFIVNLMKCFGI